MIVYEGDPIVVWVGASCIKQRCIAPWMEWFFSTFQKMKGNSLWDKVEVQCVVEMWIPSVVRNVLPTGFVSTLWWCSMDIFLPMFTKTWLCMKSSLCTDSIELIISLISLAVSTLGLWEAFNPSSAVLPWFISLWTGMIIHGFGQNLGYCFRCYKLIILNN